MRRRKSRPQDRPVAREFGIPRETSRNRSRSRADAVTSQTAVRACGAPNFGTARAGNVQDTAHTLHGPLFVLCAPIARPHRLEALGPIPREGARVGFREVGVTGRPDPEHISTSHVERQDLTMRMGMRRFTRLTNGFSKKVDYHLWAIALHYEHYNFCQIPESLRVTPAMEAGIANHVRSIEEIADLLETHSNGVAA
jgi:hypothetical protein